MNLRVLFFINLLIIVFVIKTMGQELDTVVTKAYQFEIIKELPTTPVKDQASSGTCWSFATTSFVEAELLRLGYGEVDLSEMFFVRQAYTSKALKYIRYHGSANFGEGGQAHDVLNIIREYGMVPEVVYSGLNYGFSYHNHKEMVRIVKGILDNSLEDEDGFTGKSLEVAGDALNSYLGVLPVEFDYNGKSITPVEFAKVTGIEPDDYIEFTSFKCYPYDKFVDLEIPDNWSHNKYFNVTLSDMMRIIDSAIENGFTVDWDGDVSEYGFSYKEGVAIVPETKPQNMSEIERARWDTLSRVDRHSMLYGFSEPVDEVKVTEDIRQKSFDTFKTTDDHLMHIIGTAKDQKGTLYYIIKNSWAKDSNSMGGKMFMSRAYVELKTVAILVHKDAVPKDILKKIDL